MDEIRINDTVRLKANAVSYNGRIIAGALKKEKWRVDKVQGDRLWLEAVTDDPRKQVRLTVNRKYIRSKMKEEWNHVDER